MNALASLDGVCHGQPEPKSGDTICIVPFPDQVGNRITLKCAKARKPPAGLILFL